MSWVHALERSLGADGAALTGGLVLFTLLVVIGALRRRGALRAARWVASACALVALAGIVAATLEPMTTGGHDAPRRLILDPVLGASDGHGRTVWRPLLANVALFVPAGALLAARRPGRGRSTWLALVALSAGIEAAQYLLPIGRIPNAADLVANAAGAAVGIALARLLVPPSQPSPPVPPVRRVRAVA